VNHVLIVHEVGADELDGDLAPGLFVAANSTMPMPPRRARGGFQNVQPGEHAGTSRRQEHALGDQFSHGSGERGNGGTEAG